MPLAASDKKNDLSIEGTDTGSEHSRVNSPLCEDSGALLSPDSLSADQPVLLIILGLGAVGKMTVARSLSSVLGSGWLFTHNHQSIDLVKSMEPLSDEISWPLVEAIRSAVREHAYSSRLSMIMTNVYRARNPMDAAYIRRIAFEAAQEGYRVCVAYLVADFSTRSARDRMLDRLLEKPCKENAWESQSLLAMELEAGGKESVAAEELSESLDVDISNIVVVDTMGRDAESEAREIIERLGQAGVSRAEVGTMPE